MGKRKIREEAKRLNPIDDALFRKMAEDRNFCEEILRVFLSEPELKVIKNHAQQDVTNLQGRAVILDAVCLLGDGRTVNIEVQKADDDDHQRRVRYNGAVLTANITDPGKEFRSVPNVCIVFVSRFDLFKMGHVLYHVDRVIRETKAVVDNGFEEIYINAKVKDGSDIAELMEIFTKDDAYNYKKFPVTSESKHRYKETKGGQDIMCDIVQRLIDEEMQEANEKIARMEKASEEKDKRIAELEALLAQKT